MKTNMQNTRSVPPRGNVSKIKKKEITLTEEQQSVFEKIKEFMDNDEEVAIVIKGSAGVGKSYLTKIIADYITNEKHKPIVAIAPTHKARRVLHKFLNGDRFLPIPTMTVASILGKMREHGYIGAHKYSRGTTQKMDEYDVFILDEVSMVADKDLNVMIDYMCEYDRKIIIIGDDCQIPCPSQHLIREGDFCQKPDSLAFEFENLCHMTHIIRQAAESPIIRLATYLRDHILVENTLQDLLTGTGMDPKEICIETQDLYQYVKEDIQNGLSTRVIAYTNATVRNHNMEIRKILGYTVPFVQGELLTGYNNVGFPVPVIQNGSDYIVQTVDSIKNKKILSYISLAGYRIQLQDIDDEKHISKNLFFISVKHSNNVAFMQELVRRAEKVNRVNSTKDDFRKYCQLKNQAIFIEDVYKHDNKILSETELKQLHPLLFTRINEVINETEKVKIPTELSFKIEEQYGDIIGTRISDNKAMADGEVFADQFKVVEKDIYYGYAITGHKCQGSTYDHVYVDEKDFAKLSNKWNYRYRAIENRYKEQNQLRYVAYTRAAKQLMIFLPEMPSL
jgi:hypothetical protein